jgi:hypothetical protein
MREMDSRSSDGITVSLFWNCETEEVYVEIEAAGDYEIFPVPASEALQAFQHPFVYAAANSHGHGVTV